MPTTDRWYHLLAYFVGGAFLANFVPHFVQGISGAPFQSPFATPPGEGLSSALLNVVWSLVNLLVAYLLVVRVGAFDLRKTKHAAVLGAGIAMMALMLAHHFGRFHGGA
jgi:hypothetical protein